MVASVILPILPSIFKSASNNSSNGFGSARPAREHKVQPRRGQR